MLIKNKKSKLNKTLLIYLKRMKSIKYENSKSDFLAQLLTKFKENEIAKKEKLIKLYGFVFSAEQNFADYSLIIVYIKRFFNIRDMARKKK